MRDPSLCSKPGIGGRGQLPPGGPVKLGSRGSQGGLGGKGMGQGQVPCAPTAASPSRAPGSLQAGLAAAGLAWEGLRKELELPHTPLLGQLSPRRAEGSRRCVGRLRGGVRFGRSSLWLPLYRLGAGGRGTAAVFRLTPGTGLCAGGSPFPTIHWLTGGIPLPSLTKCRILKI